MTSMHLIVLVRILEEKFSLKSLEETPKDNIDLSRVYRYWLSRNPYNLVMDF